MTTDDLDVYLAIAKRDEIIVELTTRIASQAAEIAALKADLLDASDAHLWIRKNRELAAEVERLKRNDDSYRDIANQSRLNINRLSVLADAQAAEIERLRKQHGLWHETSIPQLYAENASQAAEIERLRETHLLQLAGISTAAMGYHKASDSIHPDFKTTALDDVMELYAKYDALFQAALRGDKP